LIDADPQWNTSLVFGINSEAENPKTLYDLFKGDKFSEVLINISPTLDLIPSSLRLSRAEMLLRQKNNGQMRLSMLLSSVKHLYDLIVIDTNPSLLFLNINAFLAADELCIVSETELFSVSGMTSMFEVIDELAADYPDFRPGIRIIPNVFDIRESSCQMAIGALRQHYSEFITNTVIRKSADFKEAQNAALAIFLYKKKSHATQDMEALAKELLQDKDVTVWASSSAQAALLGHVQEHGEGALHG
jgi:chromosome partitioning protein